MSYYDFRSWCSLAGPWAGLLAGVLVCMPVLPAAASVVNSDLELIGTGDVVQWQIPPDAQKLSVLVVGAGGGGAPGLGRAGGGGGAGGLVYVDDYLQVFGAKPGDAVEIRIGPPGPIVKLKGAHTAHPGSNSCFGKIVALGGGGGGRSKDPRNYATPGGSAGGGVADTNDNPAAALQSAESGVGMGFGHPGGSGAGGSGGGGAGGPGTLMGQGGGGSGLQGLPLKQYVDARTGYVSDAFEATNAAHYKVLFRDVFGPQFGEDGWFAGGGAHNSPKHKDEGGKGGGSKRHALPHTGGGGGGSTHTHEGSEPGIGGSGVVLVRCLHANRSVTVHGWGLLQPDDVTLRRMLDEPTWLSKQGKYDAALELLDAYDPKELSVRVRVELLSAYAQIYAGQGREYDAALELLNAYDPEELPVRVRVELLRAYAQIYAGQGREKESWGKFREANRVEKK